MLLILLYKVRQEKYKCSLFKDKVDVVNCEETQRLQPIFPSSVKKIGFRLSHEITVDYVRMCVFPFLTFERLYRLSRNFVLTVCRQILLRLGAFLICNREVEYNMANARTIELGVTFNEGTSVINTGFLDFVHRPEFYN
jgi:hypothetical protein